jgi:hypothetical protein
MLDGMSLLRMRRSWPVATAAVLAVTVVLTVLQFLFPQVRLALWRDRRLEHDLGRLSREASSQGGGGHDPEHGAAATAPSGSPTSWSTWATPCSARACGRPER